MTPGKRGIGNIDDWVAQRVGSPRLDPESIRAYQFQGIRETLRRAKLRSPFYGKSLSEIDPDAVRRAEDFSAVPLLSDHDLRENGMRMLCVSQSDISRVVTLDTSGTTGPPKRLFFTEEDQALTRRFFREGMASFIEPGDRVLILLPGSREGSVGEALFRALEGSGAVPIAHGPVEGALSTLTKMKTERVTCLVGVPNQVLFLARVHEALGHGGFPRPRRVLLSTDLASDALARELSRIWGSEVTRYYGMTELGYGGGIECGYHGGYHLYEGDIYAEILDPDTGLAMKDGEWGEVVVTTLTREGMPMIRYRTGDISRIAAGPCPCGSPLRRLDGIPARREETFRLRNGGLLRLSDLDEALFGAPGLLDFSAELERRAEGDRLRLTLDMLGTNPERSLCTIRLRECPVLRDAVEAGVLELVVSYRPCGPESLPRYGKRRITTAAARER